MPALGHQFTAATTAPTAAQIPTNGNRTGLWVRNMDPTNPVYMSGQIGAAGTSGVSATTGHQIPALTAWQSTCSEDAQHAYSFISTGAGVQVSWLEAATP